MNITATLFGQIVAFVLLILFVNKFLWGPVSNMLLDRQKQDREALLLAGQQELEQAETKVKELLHEARAKAGEILAQAEKRGSDIVEDAKKDARAEGERLLTAANAEIEREVNRAKEHLRAQVSTLAVAGASKILKREIDAKSHQDILSGLVAQI